MRNFQCSMKVSILLVIIEASNYYNSVQFLIWVLIDNIDVDRTSIGVYTTLYLTLVYIFGTRSTQDQVRAAGGKRVGIKTSHSRSLLTFKTQKIALKMKSVRMVRPHVMSRGGRLVHSPTAGVARLGKV